jgi:hypothetical protein
MLTTPSFFSSFLKRMGCVILFPAANTDLPAFSHRFILDANIT